MNNFKVESMTLEPHSNNFWGLTQLVLAELNDLTHQFQRVINNKSNSRHPLQTFAEYVDDQQSIIDGPVTLFVIRVNSIIRAFSVVVADRHPVINSLVVSEQFRLCGLGIKLLTGVREYFAASSLKLYCLKRDPGALNFYLNAGGIEDHDHLSRHTHSIIFPSLKSLRSKYALPRERSTTDKNKNMDF